MWREETVETEGEAVIFFWLPTIYFSGFCGDLPKTECLIRIGTETGRS